MKGKKVMKIILIITTLLIVLLLAIYINHRIRLKKEEKLLLPLGHR